MAYRPYKKHNKKLIFVQINTRLRISRRSVGRDFRRVDKNLTCSFRSGGRSIRRLVK